MICGEKYWFDLVMLLLRGLHCPTFVARDNLIRTNTFAFVTAFSITKISILSAHFECTPKYYFTSTIVLEMLAFSCKRNEKLFAILYRMVATEVHLRAIELLLMLLPTF